MIKKTMIIFLSVFSFLSCDTKIETIYSYKDIKIRRIDTNGKTSFYYNEIGNDKPQIWAEYSGIGGDFQGYLKYEDDGKVSLLSGNGYFQSSNIDTSKFEYKRIAAYQRPTLGANVYYIQLSIKYEREKNLNTGTKVKAIYPD